MILLGDRSSYENEAFVAATAKPIKDRIEGRLNCIRLMREHDVSSEEWARIEILEALTGAADVTVISTNKVYPKKASKKKAGKKKKVTARGRFRPDFVVRIGAVECRVELKLLPTSHNYETGWQRFQANKGNHKDFSFLEAGDRDGVIYIYWHSKKDWRNTKDEIKEKYEVRCLQEDLIELNNEEVVIVSYWAV